MYQVYTYTSDDQNSIAATHSPGIDAHANNIPLLFLAYIELIIYFNDFPPGFLPFPGPAALQLKIQCTLEGRTISFTHFPQAISMYYLSYRSCNLELVIVLLYYAPRPVVSEYNRYPLLDIFSDYRSINAYVLFREE